MKAVLSLFVVLGMVSSVAQAAAPAPEYSCKVHNAIFGSKTKKDVFFNDTVKVEMTSIRDIQAGRGYKTATVISEEANRKYNLTFTINDLANQDKEDRYVTYQLQVYDRKASTSKNGVFVTAIANQGLKVLSKPQAFSQTYNPKTGVYDELSFDCTQIKK